MRRSSAAQLALPIDQDVSLAITPCSLRGHVGVMCYAEGRDAFRALVRDGARLFSGSIIRQLCPRPRAQRLLPPGRRSLELQLHRLGNHTSEATARAGYSSRNAHGIGCRLLKVDHVRAAVQAGMRRKIEETRITREKVVGMVLDVLSAAKADGTLIAQLRALQLLARPRGYLGNQRTGRVIRGFDDFTDDELQSLELKQAVAGPDPLQR